jgi:hypothetical protein
MVKSNSDSFFKGMHNKILDLNTSKMFAGLMIITLNIASKFVTFKFGKTTEMYLKYTFSRQILVFAMAWMGTRDIYVAAGLTLVFIVLFDFLFNENSSLCILPNELKEYYQNIDEDISHDDYMKAQATVEKYTEQKDTKKCNCASSK